MGGQNLSEGEFFRDFDEFNELFNYVQAYFSGGPMFENIYEEMDGLRFQLQPVLRCGYFTDNVIGLNLGIARSTARRFLRHGRYPSHATFLRMMHALADQYDIDKSLRRDSSSAAHEAQVKFEGALNTAKHEGQDALDELLDALDGLIPKSQHLPESNLKPVELTPEQYTLLVATVRSAQAFSEVETWDQKTIRVMRALNDILLDLDKLLDTATSVFGKRLRGAIQLVTKPIRIIIDALDGDGKGQ